MSRAAVLSVEAIVLSNRRMGRDWLGRAYLSNRCLSLKDEWEEGRAFPVMGTLCKSPVVEARCGSMKN